MLSLFSSNRPQIYPPRRNDQLVVRAYLVFLGTPHKETAAIIVIIHHRNSIKSTLTSIKQQAVDCDKKTNHSGNDQLWSVINTSRQFVCSLFCSMLQASRYIVAFFYCYHPHNRFANSTLPRRSFRGCTRMKEEKKLTVRARTVSRRHPGLKIRSRSWKNFRRS